MVIKLDERKILQGCHARAVDSNFCDEMLTRDLFPVVSLFV